MKNSTHSYLEILLAEQERRRRESERKQASGAVHTPEMPLDAFIGAFWGVVEPSVSYVPNWHLDIIADHLTAVVDGDIRRLIINIPPRHMKSLSACVFFPAWVWSFRPATQFLYASYAQTLSVRDSTRCRRLIQSPEYRRQYGDVYQITADQNQKTRYDNNRSGYRIATSVGGSLTGEGGDIIIIDDPHKTDDALSDTKRNAALEWFDSAMSTRLNDPRTGAYVIVGQRVHERDLCGHLLEQGGYYHLSLPVEYEPTTTVWFNEQVDPRTEPDELLWADRFGREEIDELKTRLGAYNVAGQLQQRPAPLEGGVIKTDWIQWYTVAPTFDAVVQSWDMTFKQTKSGSFVVGQVWGMVGADKYLLFQIRKRLDFTETLNAVRRVTAEYPDTIKLVEEKANGAAVINTLRSEIENIIPINTKTFRWSDQSKEARLNAVAPQFAAGNVYLPMEENAPWIPDYVQELTTFPSARHDDQVDATSQALLYLSDMWMENWIDDVSEPDEQGLFWVDDDDMSVGVL
jgi:predicted phage terminase large subunit-like protein